MTLKAHWLPPGCPVEPDEYTRTYERGGQQVTVAFPILDTQDIQSIADYLREQQQQVLATRSVSDIVHSLDRAAKLWLDPEYKARKQACKSIHVVAGFSETMVDHAIDLEQRSSRAADMFSALDRELGHHTVLDGFVQSPKGRTTAIGPGLIGGIFSANIPALPHLTVMRSFLVKAACMGRVSTKEPIYLALYAQSLAEIDPELASCLAVIHWDHEDLELEAAFTDSIDHIIAYGSDDALMAISHRCPPSLPGTWHGHKMGFAYLGKDALDGDVEALASQIAYDFSLFDQHACLAPQACFVARGGAIEPRDFAVLLAAEMTRWLQELPARTLLPNEAAPLRAALDAVQLDGMLTPDEAAEILSPQDRLQGVVLFERPTQFLPVPLERFARVIPVDGMDDLLTYLEPIGEYLQCAAVDGTDDNERRRLAAIGVSRLCPPGRMGTPTMVWRHDGVGCLEALVRWCDEESAEPA